MDTSNANRLMRVRILSRTNFPCVAQLVEHRYNKTVIVCSPSGGVDDGYFAEPVVAGSNPAAWFADGEDVGYFYLGIYNRHRLFLSNFLKTK